MPTRVQWFHVHIPAASVFCWFCVELKENLKSMFKQFGEIRQIVAMSSFWRRYVDRWSFSGSLLERELRDAQASADLSTL